MARRGSTGSSSAVIEGDDLRLYYGAADTCIAIAEGRLSELVDFIKTHSFEPEERPL